MIYALERMVGQEVFLELVTAYLKKFAYGTVTSEEFREFCISFWQSTNQDAHFKVKEFDWEKWIYGTGMPPLPEFNKTLAEAAESLAASWIAFNNGKESNPPDTDISKWSSGQKICFLDGLLKLAQDDGGGVPIKLELSTLQLLEKNYGFQTSKNAEILFRYCMLAVQSEDERIQPTVVRFVTSQGRMKYVRPLYRAMFASSIARDVAVDTFVKNKDFYHPIASKMIAYDMTRGEGKTIIGKLKNKLSSVGKLDSTSVAMGVAAAVAVGAITLMKTKK